jgi:hypothetical protein
MAKKANNPNPKSRRAPARAAATATAPKTRLEVMIDFPQEGDVVRPGHYAVRVGAAGAGQVQFRVGEGPWQECRESVGYWWFDWAPESGPTRLSARARVGKGRWASASERACVVVGALDA